MARHLSSHLKILPSGGIVESFDFFMKVCILFHCNSLRTNKGCVFRGSVLKAEGAADRSTEGNETDKMEGHHMFKALKFSVLAACAVVAVSQPTMAREFGDIYEECGIGAMIAPRNPGVAAVTNVTWDSGTTAISSNISSPDTCSGGKEKVAAFIFDSYEYIEKDLASGQGTYLNALVILAGYNSQNSDGFVRALRNDFAIAVGDPSYTDQSRLDKAKTLYDLVGKHGGAML